MVLWVFIPSSCELTNIFPAEASSSSRAIRVQVAISEVTLLVEPQTAFVIIHYLLPVETTPVMIGATVEETLCICIKAV